MSSYHPNNIRFTKDKIQLCIDYLEGRGHLTYSWFKDCSVKEGKLYFAGKLVVTEAEIDQILAELYSNPLVTGNRDRLYAYVEERYVGISRRRVMLFLKNQESYQLRVRINKPKITQPIVNFEVNGHWQMDLFDFSKYPDQGYHWCLTVIDVFSKYLWARPLANKEGLSVKTALSDIFQQRRPLILQSDNGTEFKNSDVKQLLDLYHIQQVFSKSYAPTTQGLVERMNQTLKNLLLTNMLRNGNKKWVADLPKFVQNINNAKQATIQERPALVQQNNPALSAQVEQRLRTHHSKNSKPAPKFSIGARVRISVKSLPQNRRNTFVNGIERWTRQIYSISRVIPPRTTEPWDQARYVVDGQTYSGFELQYVNLTTLQARPPPPRAIPPPRPPPSEPVLRRSGRQTKANVRLRDL